MQRQCLQIPIKSGHEQDVISWIRSLNDRSDEVSEALASEEITSECVILLKSEDGYYVLLYTAGKDLQKSSDAFQASTLEVDSQFKDLMVSALDLTRAFVQEVLFGWP